MYRRALAAVASLALATAAYPLMSGSAGAAPPEDPAPASATRAGSFALTGEAALRFALPEDVVEVHRSVQADGTVSTRYQQKVGRARVLNGQITVVRHPDGQRTVIGAHYPGLTSAKEKKLSARDAMGVARARHGAAGNESTRLRIDPRNGRLFYEIDQIRDASRYITWVDARTGAIIKSYNALTENESQGRGVGVKNDRKRIETVFRNGAWRMRAIDGNGADTVGDAAQLTRNARGIFRYGGKVLFDQDNVWNRRAFRYHHPDQRPGVDAHYYADVVDDYFADTFGRNSIDDEGMTLRSTVHFGKDYCNAFWNGEQMTYGDGNGTTCKPLSGGLDVVGHELTHGVTDFSSNLIYEDESGALNEAFSDIMGNSIEFYAEAQGRDPAAEPDWRIGEDVITIYENPGFRNMADPQEFGDPDHYAERYTGEEDNGGVHINSGIPNHAYYLLVNGGRNAGCEGSVSGHTHTRGCTFEVDAIGLENAEQIFYTAFTGLTEYANMCDARNATVALGGYRGYARNLKAAWGAVGVLGGCTGGVPPPPPCIGDRTAELPFGARDYGNDADCTWIYDNGEPRFQFGFSLLDTEEDYDYVYVKDGNGNVLDTYTGTYETPVWSSCIPTPTGQVQLVSDAAVKAEGFMVTEVRPC